MEHYTYRAEWSPDEGAYVGCCVELPYLSRSAGCAEEAVAAIVAAVDEHLADLRDCGEQAPTPLTERHYGGTFVVRTSRALHARLAIAATEQGVSMNHWVVQQLSRRQPADPFFD